MFQRLTKIVHCNKYDSINVFFAFYLSVVSQQNETGDSPEPPVSTHYLTNLNTYY